jgi:hypothetical protein
MLTAAKPDLQPQIGRARGKGSQRVVRVCRVKPQPRQGGAQQQVLPGA